MLVDQGVRRQLTSLLWSSPYRGVTWEKAQQRWHAQIVHQGNPEYLGGFDCEKDAAMAYDRRASELGRHEALNFATKQLNVAWKVEPTADADTPSTKQICDFCGQEGHVSDACPRLLKFQRLQGSLFGTAVPPTPVRQRIKPTTFMPGEGGGSAVAGDADRIKSEPTEPAQAESAGPAASRKGSGPPAAAGSAPSSEKSKSEKAASRSRSRKRKHVAIMQPVCAPCRKLKKGYSFCRVQRQHDAPPWTADDGAEPASEADEAISDEEDVAERASESDGRDEEEDDDAHSASADSLEAADSTASSKAAAEDLSLAAVCSACRRKKRGRTFCRVQKGHDAIPWNERKRSGGRRK